MSPSENDKLQARERKQTNRKKPEKTARNKKAKLQQKRKTTHEAQMPNMPQNRHKCVPEFFLLEKREPYVIPQGTMSYSIQSFSTDVLTKAIQKYLREKVSKKIRKRKENGWEAVHAEMKICELSENIRNLPSELREKILKHLIEIKVNEKKNMGWGNIHKQIKNLPYCEIQGQVTKVFVCKKCNTCKVPGLCVACYENEMCQECKPRKSKEFCLGCYENKTKYHKLVSREEAVDQQEKGFARAWGTTKQISESPKEIKEWEENIKTLRLQSFIDKLCKEYLEQKAEKRRKKGREVVAEKCLDTLP